jgi:hypothetical protein
MNRSLKLHSQVSFLLGGVQFWLVDEFRDGKRAFGEPVTMKTEEHDGLLHEPTFVLDKDCAQEFFEELWAAGFRSIHDTGGADKLDAARREHIGDLRKAAFPEPVIEMQQQRRDK